MKYNLWNFLYIIVYLFFSYIFEVYKGNLIWKSDDVNIYLLIFYYFLDERFICNLEFKEFFILLFCDLLLCVIFYFFNFYLIVEILKFSLDFELLLFLLN